MRVLLLALLCVGCGRIAFDPRSLDGDAGAGSDDGSTGDDGTQADGVRVQVMETTLDATTKTVTVAAVDMSRTLLLCDYRTSAASAGKQPACALTSPTEVTVMAGIMEITTIVRIQLVELPVGSTVRRGSIDMGSNEMMSSMPTGANNIGTQFPVISSWQSLDATSLDERFRIGVNLGTSDITLLRAATGNTVHVFWQIVEIAGATVQPGFAMFMMAGQQSTVNLPGLDLSRAFIVGTAWVNSGNEEENLFRYELYDNAGTPAMRVARSGAGTTTAAVYYYVVTLAGVRVDRGAELFATETALSTGILRTWDPQRSMILTTASGGRPGQASDLDETVATADFLGTDMVVLTRGASPATDVGSVVAWQVVEWQ